MRLLGVLLVTACVTPTRQHPPPDSPDSPAALAPVAAAPRPSDGDPALLDRVAEVLRRYPAVRFEVTNHQDATNGPEYGRGLTCRRADVVKRYLVERGVDARQLQARGMGSDVPLATNKTAAGRANNRRTELTIVRP